MFGLCLFLIHQTFVSDVDQMDIRIEFGSGSLRLSEVDPFVILWFVVVVEIHQSLVSEVDLFWFGVGIGIPQIFVSEVDPLCSWLT